MAEMRAVGKTFGGTINDVAVAAFDAGVHRCLREQGKEDMRKMSKDAAVIYALATFGLGELNEITPANRVTKALANFVLSNVPGVPHSVYLGDARLCGLYPVSTMGGGIGLNATLASYAGSIDFGFVANKMSLPDLRPLVAHCAQAFAELKRAAAARAPVDAAAPAEAAAAPAVKKSGQIAAKPAATGAAAARNKSAEKKSAAKKAVAKRAVAKMAPAKKASAKAVRKKAAAPSPSGRKRATNARAAAR